MGIVGLGFLVYNLLNLQWQGPLGAPPRHSSRLPHWDSLTQHALCKSGCICIPVSLFLFLKAFRICSPVACSSQWEAFLGRIYAGSLSRPYLVQLTLVLDSECSFCSHGSQPFDLRSMGSQIKFSKWSPGEPVFLAFPSTSETVTWTHTKVAQPIHTHNIQLQPCQSNRNDKLVH